MEYEYKTEHEYIGKIVHLFNNGQSSNGWFSGYFETNVSPYRFRVVGTYKNDIDKNMEYKITIGPAEDKGFGLQHRIIHMMPNIKRSRKEIFQYLSGGSFNGIGAVIANKIVDAFGEDTLSIIEQTPERLRDLNLTEKQVDIITSGYASVSVENQIRKLVPDISKKLLEKIIDVYCKDDSCGAKYVITLIKSSPYQLLQDLEHVSFKEIDHIALSVGFDLYNKTRIEECYNNALHTYFSDTKNLYLDCTNIEAYNKVYLQVLENVGYTTANGTKQNPIYEEKCVAIVNTLFEHPEELIKIHVDYQNGTPIIYQTETYKAECHVAKFIAEQLHQTSVFFKLTGCKPSEIEQDIDIYEKKKRKDINHFKLDDSQRQAVLFGLMNNIVIIKGGPGHGKTSVVECILFIWDKHMNALSYEKNPVLSAPTGRAVTVLKNAVGEIHEDDAKTLMRRIYNMGRLERDIRENNTNRNSVSEMQVMLKELKNSYKDTLIITDECSMAGVNTISQFIHMFQGCQFLFVGDVDQLPSIESGQFFKDICDSGLITTCELTENHRAEGAIIVENAEKINRGDVQGIDFSDVEHFAMIPCCGDYSNILMKEYMDFVSPGGTLDIDRLKRICILCPTKNYSTGHQLLNIMIQNMVNPENNQAKQNERGYSINSSYIYLDKNKSHANLKLRVGDRIMQTKNNEKIECISFHNARKKISHGISNGDTGIIIGVNAPSTRHESIEVLFDDGRQATIESDGIKYLVLAYAISVHKSQGSEYDFVLFSSQSLYNCNESFACRNLVYTAVTRAKKQVKIIGDDVSFFQCVITESPFRNSMLRNRIIQEYKWIKENVKTV